MVEGFVFRLLTCSNRLLEMVAAVRSHESETVSVCILLPSSASVLFSFLFCPFPFQGDFDGLFCGWSGRVVLVSSFQLARFLFTDMCDKPQPLKTNKPGTGSKQQKVHLSVCAPRVPDCLVNHLAKHVHHVQDAAVEDQRPSFQLNTFWLL